MPAPKSLPGFNVAAAVHRMLDQPELWWQSVGLFVEHFSGWSKDWHATVGDVILERKKVHALRSAAANVGAEQLSQAAAALENFLLRPLQASEDGKLLRKQLEAAFETAWGAASAAWRQQSDRAANES